MDKQHAGTAFLPLLKSSLHSHFGPSTMQHTVIGSAHVYFLATTAANSPLNMLRRALSICQRLPRLPTAKHNTVPHCVTRLFRANCLWVRRCGRMKLVTGPMSQKPLLDCKWQLLFQNGCDPVARDKNEHTLHSQAGSVPH